MCTEEADCTCGTDNDSIFEAIHLRALNPETSTSITASQLSSKIYYINAARPTGLGDDLMACTKSPSSKSDPTPLFYIATTHFSSKPSLTLHSGPTKTSPVLGVAYLTFFSSQNFLGIGDPDPMTRRGRDGREVIWERLERVSRWLHGVYSFSFARGLGGEGTGEMTRRRFLWKRTRLNIFDDQGDMELVEDWDDDVDGAESGQGDADADGRERKGEVLASYEGVGLFKWKKRGRLMIKEGGGWAWEVMVILSAMALVELSRRRARQRNH